MFDDFQLIYGNKNKMDHASGVAKNIFAQKEPVTEVSITETVPGIAIINPGVETKVTSEYLAESDHGTRYEWSSSETVVYDENYSHICYVETINSKHETGFDLSVTAFDALGNIISVTESFIHTRNEIPKLTITAINELSNDSCEYVTGGTCATESRYQVAISNGPVSTYKWTVDNGNAVISGSNTTDTVTVTSNTGNEVSFDISIEVTDDTGSDKMTGSFMHDRTERTPIDITGFEETSSGCCVYG